MDESTESAAPTTDEFLVQGDLSADASVAADDGAGTHQAGAATATNGEPPVNSRAHVDVHEDKGIEQANQRANESNSSNTMTNETTRTDAAQSSGDNSMDGASASDEGSGSAQSANDADGGTSETNAKPADSPNAASPDRDVQAQLEKYREDYLRAVAELQNVKRRSESDVSKAKKYGAESMARGLLDVKDSLDLARSVDLSDAREDAISKMQEGLELTLKQLEAVLEKHGVVEVCPEMGDKLDPTLHQAMSMQASETVKSNHVLAVVQKGYQLHDRLLRAAMVVVATGPVDGTSSSPAAVDESNDGEQNAKEDANS